VAVLEPDRRIGTCVSSQEQDTGGNKHLVPRQIRPVNGHADADADFARNVNWLFSGCLDQGKATNPIIEQMQ